ncbi:hypothetical protein WOLCODRAFT_150558 [Wolfiporia cocos MD-104 SS10]|uniref:Uncharacterized protein n=1 Tax=Wolfiporia cocos (strain MD-104) TaxID=742152 RepID=A0A2H3JE75_WOLCO|nr:hypothetical protein WOLCODRAFT_150558 [Wolfiporia cocos MD-104 SS10]
MLLAVIILFLGLGMLTQLLTKGPMQCWLPTSGSSGGDCRNMWVVWGKWGFEDWGIMLAQIGTACLEVAMTARLGNKVGSMSAGTMQHVGGLPVASLCVGVPAPPYHLPKML